MGGTQCPSATIKQRTISLKSSDGAASSETALLHLLPLRPHHQGSPPNQPEQSKGKEKNIFLKRQASRVDSCKDELIRCQLLNQPPTILTIDLSV